MKPSQLFQLLTVDKSVATQTGFNPYYRHLDTFGPAMPTIDGKPYLDLASNDYLGLSSDKRIHEAMIGAIERFGSSMCGTPIATGYAQVLEQLEMESAAFVGLESAVIFPSCYQANCSLFSSIAGPEDTVLVDHFAHASLLHGIKASGARLKPFLHNDMANLERQLSSPKRPRRLFVATESVFSTEGSIAPLKTILELCRRYDATPVIDDSHGIGVIGAGGRGILEHAGINDFDGIYTASLGKALAGSGGMIAGTAECIDYLRYRCAGLIYSTALAPACAAGLLVSIEIVRKEFNRIGHKMWCDHRNLIAVLDQCGFRLRKSEAPIASVICGSAQRTVQLAKAFFEKGIMSTPFIPPSVPPEQGVVRLIVGAKLDDERVQTMGNALEETGRHFNS